MFLCCYCIVYGLSIVLCLLLNIFGLSIVLCLLLNIFGLSIAFLLLNSLGLTIVSIYITSPLESHLVGVGM